MKKLTIILSLLFALCGVRAEDTIVVVQNTVIEAIQRPNLLDSMPGVQVVQDSMVAELLETAMFGSRELVEIDGYRVQIYSSNQQQTAKSEALNLEARLKDKVSQTIYVTYLPPFWKVRIGDFRTYEEAREYKKLFVQLYPNMVGDTYIVRDKIKVRQ
ncbi:MAG: SPOR domain-containing protein [Paludibacteraceae bacterium]|nr:SPOR domain-containing protein [Paludibacteraceae bacterium]